MFLFGAALLALAGELIGKAATERCVVDGAIVRPISRVEVRTPTGENVLFCSLCCARTWLDANPGIAAGLSRGDGQLTVTDEVSGQAMDASLAYWVESSRPSRRHNRCRAHVFQEIEDASRHLLDYQGRELPGYLAGLGQALPWARDFTTHEPGGKAFRLSGMRGGIVFLRFWSSANPMAAADLAELENAHRRFQERGFTVIAVNVEETPEVTRAMQKQLGITFPMTGDPEGRIADQYGVHGFPTGFLIDSAGIIRQRIIGEVPAKVMEPLINTIL